MRDGAAVDRVGECFVGQQLAAVGDALAGADLPGEVEVAEGAEVVCRHQEDDKEAEQVG
jgi:hypothetical protein